jgi:hypothetical protein
MHGFVRLAVVAVLVVMWLPTATLPAAASVGVGIQANPVQLTGTAHPGGSYSLPPLYVKNTGSQPESLSLEVERLTTPADRAASSVPSSWIQSSWSDNSTVPAGQSADIPLELVTPANAKPGSYASDIVVTGSTMPVTGSLRFGAAAATGLDFQITPAPPGGLMTWKVWTLVALIVIGAAVLTTRAYKRLGIRVRIERDYGP